MSISIQPPAYEALPTHDTAGEERGAFPLLRPQDPPPSSHSLNLRLFLFLSLTVLATYLVLTASPLSMRSLLDPSASAGSPAERGSSFQVQQLQATNADHALPSSTPPSLALPPPSLFPVTAGRVLVMYVFSDNDRGHLGNLLFFIDRALRCWHDADYRIIIQRKDAAMQRNGTANQTWLAGLPTLPPNARYVLHENECLDWGTAGWLLSLPPSHPDAVDASRYRYFFLINSSVRGPFLPAWLDFTQDVHSEVQCSAEGKVDEKTTGGRWLLPWFHLFLTRIDAQTKLVGSTISCQRFAHVQGYVAAMDYVTVQLLWQLVGNVEQPTSVAVEHDFARWSASNLLLSLPQNLNSPLACPVDYNVAVEQSEIGASRVMLKAGYNLASLQQIWTGVDFRELPDPCEPGQWKDHSNPTYDGTALRFDSLDRIALHPSDVVFLKRKGDPIHVHDRAIDFWLSWDERAHARREKRSLRTPLFNSSASDGRTSDVVRAST